VKCKVLVVVSLLKLVGVKSSQGGAIIAATTCCKISELISSFVLSFHKHKFQFPKLRYETLETSGIFINPYFMFCPAIYGQSSTCRCYLE